MASIREQALAAIVTALNTGRPGDVAEFERDRANPHGSASLPAGNVCIAPISQPQEQADPAGGRQTSGPVTLKTLLVATEYMNAGATSACLDEGLIWTQSVLGGSRLGGLVHWVEQVSTTWQRVSADAEYWKATRVWAVRYQTARSNEESKT